MIFNVMRPTKITELNKIKGTPLGKGDIINILTDYVIYDYSVSNVVFKGQHCKLEDFNLLAERE